MRSDYTLRVPKLVNHDEQFEISQRAGIDPIILNMFDLSDPNFGEQISSRVFSDGNATDFIARCQCGAQEGNKKIGMHCNICNSDVSLNNLLDDDNMLCRNWLSAPEELPHGWLTPKIYLNLAKWLSYAKNQRNYLDDILDVDTPIPFELRDIITDKGFTYLYENFDRIITYFATAHPIISVKPETVAMRYCLEMYKDRIFCRYVPILNSAISPIVSGEPGRASKNQYSDVTTDHVIQAATSLSKLKFSPGRRRRNDRILQVERTAYKAFKDIINYVEEATAKYISKKKAIPRTHIFGSRFHYSYRGVVVPITEPHEPYELHIPWKIAVNTLRVHLIGILVNEYGYRPDLAYIKVRNALQWRDPEIREIFDRMIANHPMPGLPSLWDRPPSIRDGSVMMKFWTKIKDDIDDPTIGISPIDAKLPNVDRINRMLSQINA